MIAFHFQADVPDWRRAVAALPAGTPVKAVDRGDILVAAKAANPQVVTILRHWYDHGQIFDGRLWEARKQQARDFLNSFVDNTFKAQYAPHVNYIEGWNEYNAASHSPVEVEERVRWVQALTQVWATEYRTQAALSHIRLICGNVAVGNDFPVEAARACVENDAVVGYHPYIAIDPGGRIHAGDWEWYSGRHAKMDAAYKAAGINGVRYMFTEGGPVLREPSGHLNGQAGWRHPDVYNGQLSGYLDALQYWADKLKAWNATNGNRALGLTLFTTGGGSQWRYFETKQPEMDAIATQTWGGIAPPPPPPPPVNRRPLGIDVSHHQGQMNWQKAKDKGVKFAFLKASQNVTFVDPQYQRNRAECDRLGILWAPYHYYQTNRDPIAQADHFIATAGRGRPVYALDCEDKDTGTPSASDILACLQRIEQLTGIRPIIYTAKWFWQDILGGPQWSQEYDGWFAHWPANPNPQTGNPPPPSPWSTWRFWQYTVDPNGAPWGANGAIDLDVFNGTEQELRAYFAPPPGPPPPPDTPPRAVNLSFETGWQTVTDPMGKGNQEPQGWSLWTSTPGQQIWRTGATAASWPECVHKSCNELPPSQCRGASDELILHGDWVYKIQGAPGPFAAELLTRPTGAPPARFEGLTPGVMHKFTVPINVHWHPDGNRDLSTAWVSVLVFDPADPSHYGFVRASGDVIGDRRWHNINIYWTPTSARAHLRLRFFSGYPGQKVDFFIDDCRVSLADAPPPPPGQIKRIVHLPPPTLTYNEYQTIAGRAWTDGRQTVAPSADDVVTLITAATSAPDSLVYVWWAGRWAQSIEAWLRARGVNNITHRP